MSVWLCYECDFYFFHCSEHYTVVRSAEKSFSQHKSVLKSVCEVLERLR